MVSSLSSVWKHRSSPRECQAEDNVSNVSPSPPANQIEERNIPAMDIVNLAQQVEQGDDNNDDLYQQVEGSVGINKDSYQKVSKVSTTMMIPIMNNQIPTCGQMPQRNTKNK